MKEILTRGSISFAISVFAGLVVNLVIDAAANAAGAEGFISMSPEFVRLFATPVIAVYVNLLLYGVIGAVFSMMTFIFDVDRIGFVFQGIIYFAVTAAVCTGITILLWQLHRYPQALFSTLAGYGVTYVIMGVLAYRKLKDDIREINNGLQA